MAELADPIKALEAPTTKALIKDALAVLGGAVVALTAQRFANTQFPAQYFQMGTQGKPGYFYVNSGNVASVAAGLGLLAAGKGGGGTLLTEAGLGCLLTVGINKALDAAGSTDGFPSIFQSVINPPKAKYAFDDDGATFSQAFQGDMNSVYRAFSI